MGRFLNVGIIQMPVSQNTAENLRYLEERVERMMACYHRPELIVGVECIQTYTPEPMDGPTSKFFASIAKKHEIYFIPGTVYESQESLPENMYYNSAPIYNPKGELVDVYRKMAPWRPSEEFAVPGNQYVVFDIPEKDTKVGVQICYDMNFPEISRNEALMGAEVLVKLTMDPQELYELNKHIHYARALENQAYFVSTNGVGFFESFHLYGHSQVIGPEGELLWEANEEASMATVTLDLDLVKQCRSYGTKLMDHYLQHVREYAFPMPYADDVSKAPVFASLPPAPKNPGEYDLHTKEIGISAIGRRNEVPCDTEQFKTDLDQFLKEKSV